jgi:DNA-damage-inducible protein D
MPKLNSPEYKSFDSLRKVRDNGTEYWTARELAPVLEYAKWENFSKVIDRGSPAKTAVTTFWNIFLKSGKR